MTILPSTDPPARGASALRVALVCMPFASADRPSIQLGLLKAIVERDGHRADCHYLNLELAAVLSPLRYEQLCERRAHMTGEWLFSWAAFGDDAPSDEAVYFERFGHDFDWGKQHDLSKSYFQGLRREILPLFVARCARDTNWGAYDVVGFSSMFQQNVASLALARAIKAHHPHVRIVFGGANLEGEMGEEFVRSFDCVDFAVSGEGDESFPRLLKAIARRSLMLNAPGVVRRQGADVLTGGAPKSIDNLDILPVPNYQDYFECAERLELVEAYRHTWAIPFESSRGCWWGQKHHCTFCGLNGATMKFRSKAAERVRSELTELANKHKICSFIAVDNVLDTKYVKSLFGPLKDDRVDYSFFYEVKANFTREQIEALWRGGMRRVQPGIESLSTRILGLMRKGVTMLQNVRCMKWCRYYGIGVNWNLLWGFPGETEEDYRKELDVLRAIQHLEPPIGSGRIWLERFSPHFTDPSFPLHEMRPEASYAHVYPRHVDLMKLAYFFDYRMGDTVSANTRGPTNEVLDQWRASWASNHPPSLTYRRIDDAVLIDRNPTAGSETTICVTGLNARIYEACVETMRTPSDIARVLATTGAGDVSPDEVREAMDLFCGAKLMLGEDGKYLSLALPTNPNW